jgi:hypothetical protein
MVDETPPEPPQKTVAPQLQLTAQGFEFPQDVLEKWVAIPENEPLFIGPLTRGELDNLLFSTGRITQAIAAFQRAFILYTNGDLAGANAAMIEAGNANIEGETYNRRLFFAIMQSVLKGRSNAAG